MSGLLANADFQAYLIGAGLLIAGAFLPKLFAFLKEKAMGTDTTLDDEFVAWIEEIVEGKLEEYKVKKKN